MSDEPMAELPAYDLLRAAHQRIGSQGVLEWLHKNGLVFCRADDGSWRFTGEASVTEVGATEKQPRKNAVPDDKLAAVKARYEELRLEVPRRAIVTLAEELGVPRSTAHAWVQRARKRGL